MTYPAGPPGSIPARPRTIHSGSYPPLLFRSIDTRPTNRSALYQIHLSMVPCQTKARARSHLLRQKLNSRQRRGGMCGQCQPRSHQQQEDRNKCDIHTRRILTLPWLFSLVSQDMEREGGGGIKEAGGKAFSSRIPVSLFSILDATFRYLIQIFDGLELDLFPGPRFPSPRVSRCIERE